MSVKELFRKKKAAKIFADANQGEYKFNNELKSEITMEFPDGGGLMRGKYKSGVGVSGDKNGNILTGFVSGNIVSFTVNFTQEKSVAAWAGQAIWNSLDSIWEIHTLWHLVEPTSPADVWDDIQAGSDIFAQVI